MWGGALEGSRVEERSGEGGGRVGREKGWKGGDTGQEGWKVREEKRR